MGNRLDRMTCVVTGAAGGMGRASAIEMARQGARVVVSDINADGGLETTAMIVAEGGEASFFQCNLRDGRDIANLMQHAAIHFGSIDVLHNNAAVHETDLTTETSIELISEEVWAAVYEINLRAVWLAIKYAVPFLKQSGHGAIVNAASTASFVAFPMSGAYAATKGGVLMLTKAAAVDLAKYGIRSNCYCPGAIDTPMLEKYFQAAEDRTAAVKMLAGAHLNRRLGRPEEVAKLAVFLASEDSSFINGAAFAIDGGTLAWRGLNL